MKRWPSGRWRTTRKRNRSPRRNRLTRLSGSLRFDASSWSVGSIWGKSGPPTFARLRASFGWQARELIAQTKVAHHSADLSAEAQRAKVEGATVGPRETTSYGWQATLVILND